MKFFTIMVVLFCAPLTLLAKEQSILLSTDLLEAAQIESAYEHKGLGLSFAKVNQNQLEKIHSLAHEFGRCGGFQTLDEDSGLELQNVQTSFQQLQFYKMQNESYMSVLNHLFAPVKRNTKIERALLQVNNSNIERDVRWLSSFKNRHHKGGNKNDHIQTMKLRIEQMLASSNISGSVQLVSHSRTSQKSLRVRITGQTSPQEIVVLGGHHDSIRQFDFGGFLSAPGADDNASGSACLLESLRVILEQGEQPQRSIEFMWYAAEEVGLWGSTDIAQIYKSQNIDVIGVMQLDMTLFPGLGDGRIALTKDYTSSWLNKLLLDLNNLYVGVEVVDYECGYGCSDHASWHKEGYPAVFPAEASFSRDWSKVTGNKNLHTVNDVIDQNSSFEHAKVFAKLAVAFALELANSDARQPY